jgi:hypothetical protein
MLFNAWMIIIEDIRAGIGGIPRTSDALITRTEITIWQIIGNGLILRLDSRAAPGAILSVGCHDNPFFA